MVDISLYAAFLAAALALCVAPGPDMIGFAVDASVGLLVGRLSSALRGSRRIARSLNIFSGTVVTGLAVRLVAAPE
ncbi:hypothetical protein [Streptomyces sp. NBC_00075]|uniref:hypothetical protein n=1 Tax=Streptomyces sp. NBC_00075 TaxID=2975641 RepID=UPI00386CA649